MMLMKYMCIQMVLIKYHLFLNILKYQQNILKLMFLELQKSINMPCYYIARVLSKLI